MRYRPLGSSNIEASIVGLGAWAIGGGGAWGGSTDDQEAIHAIQSSFDAGVNLIDTAPAYGWGHSEELVGKAIQGRRDRVVLATKCGLWWEDERGSFFTEFDGRIMRRSLRPDTIQLEIEDSLRRLDTDWIDLYQTHWPSVEPDKTPIADTMACLLKLKDQGKIRAIGLSNVSLADLMESCQAGPVASDQLRYSMLYRQPERDLLPECQERNIATLTYMSLEQGLLTGKIGMDRQFNKGEFRSNQDWNPWYLSANRKRVLDLLAGWRDLDEKHNCTLAQLVIAWTAAQRGVTHVLCGARRPAHALENAAAGDIVLDSETLARMRRDVEALGEPVRETRSAMKG